MDFEGSRELSDPSMWAADVALECAKARMELVQTTPLTPVHSRTASCVNSGLEPDPEVSSTWAARLIDATGYARQFCQSIVGHRLTREPTSALSETTLEIADPCGSILVAYRKVSPPMLASDGFVWSCSGT